MKNTNGETSRDSGVLSSPLSFVRSGSFSLDTASIYGRSGNGHYWTLRSYDPRVSHNLLLANVYLSAQDGYMHGYGVAVRRVATFSLLYYFEFLL